MIYPQDQDIGSTASGAQMERRSSHPSPYSSTLGKGLDILELLKDGPRGSQSIGDALNLNRSTAYRLVQTLVSHGLVCRNQDGMTYALTARLWELGAVAIGTEQIRAAGGRAVSELALAYGETVHLAIYDAGEVVYIDKADSWQPIGSYTQLGGRAPAYAVATGKVLLAQQLPSEIDRVISQEIQSHTEETLTTTSALQRELEKIRSNGYATNMGEWRIDVGGVAVPLFGPSNRAVAALGFSGPKDRIYSRLEELLTALTSAGNRISNTRRF